MFLSVQQSKKKKLWLIFLCRWKEIWFHKRLRNLLSITKRYIHKLVKCYFLLKLSTKKMHKYNCTVKLNFNQLSIKDDKNDFSHQTKNWSLLKLLLHQDVELKTVIKNDKKISYFTNTDQSENVWPLHPQW